jgi:hypothetical protein
LASIFAPKNLKRGHCRWWLASPESQHDLVLATATRFPAFGPTKQY